jgi:hypothetical protein
MTATAYLSIVLSNLIDVNLSPEVKDSVFQAISTTKLAMPFLIKLSYDDRLSLQMVDDGRKPFVEKCFDLASRNALLDPGPGLLELVPNDVSLHSFLSTVENELEQLLEMVRDTKQVAGSEAYEVARFIYMKAKIDCATFHHFRVTKPVIPIGFAVPFDSFNAWLFLSGWKVIFF